MTWAQWEDLLRCAEVFSSNDTPLAPDDHERNMLRNQLNKEESEAWEAHFDTAAPGWRKW